MNRLFVNQMDPEDIPLNLKDCSDTELYLIANLQKITSSRQLLALLKEYLDEPDEQKRQQLGAQMLFMMEDKD